VASIGGVDAQLSKAASAALLAQIEAADDDDSGSKGVDAGDDNLSLKIRIPAALVALWERERAQG